mmetsp:Transcript_1680/g.5229  ORF Transcript_1680/g.5229 Transcript_1680/m.5229 type:complete len:283 (-) Transcript_1680:230-1078(-)
MPAKVRRDELSVDARSSVEAAGAKVVVMPGQEHRGVIPPKQIHQSPLLLGHRSPTGAMVRPPIGLCGHRVMLHNERRCAGVCVQRRLQSLDLWLGRGEDLATIPACKGVVGDASLAAFRLEVVVVGGLVEEAVEVDYLDPAEVRHGGHGPPAVRGPELAVAEVGRGHSRGVPVGVPAELQGPGVPRVPLDAVLAPARPVVVPEAGDEGDALVPQGLPERRVGDDGCLAVRADVAPQNDQLRVDAVPGAAFGVKVLRAVGLVGGQVVDVTPHLVICVSAHPGL